MGNRKRGRPKKSAADVLESIGSRIPKQTLTRITDVMKDLYARRRIDRETHSASIAWLIERGLEGFMQDRDPILQEVVTCWSDLTEKEHRLVRTIVSEMAKAAKLAKKGSGPRPLEDGETDEGQKPVKNPRRRNGQRGDDQDEEAPVPMRIVG